MKLKPSEIKPNPNNPRLIKDDKFKKLVQSLKDFPEMADIRQVVINKDHVILGGNMRYKAMVEAGWSEIPVKVVDWTPEKQREFIIKDNVSGGEWDWDLLANEWDTDLLEDWGLELPDSFKDEEVEEDEAPEVSSEPPVSQLGSIYQLGRHRVMCGDSTIKENVELLMAGAKADMVFTSPPYNQGGKGKRLDPLYGGQGDNKTKEEYYEFILAALIAIDCIANDDTPILWNVMYNANSRDDYGKTVFSDSNPFTVKETIVWDKKHGMNITTKGILSRDSELIFLMSRGEYYTTNQGEHEVWYNKWEIGTNKSQTPGHGAAFPVELPAKGIICFCLGDGILFDPFLGSGSTLIACEQTDRTCYGMELDPKYVDVIRKRYAKFTNNNELPDNWEELTPSI